MNKNSRILIIGRNGQIGWELERILGPLDNVIAIDYPDIDMTKPESIRATINTYRPQIVINAAAYTAVDKAESEADLAMAINGVAPGVMAEECRRLRALLVHYSTDYVYDGKKRTPYIEDDDAKPLAAYARAKLAGDLAIQAVDTPYLILRTCWVYGWRGNNFLLMMLKLASEQEEIRVVDDQIGTPNWSRDVAEATAKVLSLGQDDPYEYFSQYSGIYHFSASGRTSWYGFAKAIFEADPAAGERKLKRLIPISTAEYGSKVDRPAFAVLDTSKIERTFGLKMQPWERPIKMWGTR